MTSLWPWLTLALLGAYHGLNPGMGWLFALSLGLQEKNRRAILRALVPIALGHATAISITVLVVYFVRQVLPLNIFKIVVASLLFAMGLYRILRARHPRGGGMRVGVKDLFLWSFLMASAHGAGLMLAPVLLAKPMSGMNHSMHQASPSIFALGIPSLGLAVVVHTMGLLVVAGTLALAVYQSYEKSGLSLLQRAWFNFDLLWAIALFAAGMFALLL